MHSGRMAVDSIKAPIIGYAENPMSISLPESSLMNFAADALRETARKHSKEKIDVAITNKGGLRSELEAGAITFGDIYNIFPFENTLTLLTLDGCRLLQLLDEIAQAGGEPISGVRMSIVLDEESDKYKLADATVGGEKIVHDKQYRIATSDYLSQGNDGLSTLALGTDRKTFGITIRELMVEYIAARHSKGEKISATADKRISITTR